MFHTDLAILLDKLCSHHVTAKAFGPQEQSVQVARRLLQVLAERARTGVTLAAERSPVEALLAESEPVPSVSAVRVRHSGLPYNASSARSGP